MNRLLPTPMDVAEYVDKVHEDAKNGKIDDPTNLSNDMIYLYSGTKDTVVRPGSGYITCIINHTVIA